MKEFINETIENILGFIIYFSPAILASIVFMILGFGDVVCMAVFIIMLLITIRITDNLSRN